MAAILLYHRHRNPGHCVHIKEVLDDRYEDTADIFVHLSISIIIIIFKLYNRCLLYKTYMSYIKLSQGVNLSADKPTSPRTE